MWRYLPIRQVWGRVGSQRPPEDQGVTQPSACYTFSVGRYTQRMLAIPASEGALRAAMEVVAEAEAEIGELRRQLQMSCGGHTKKVVWKHPKRGEAILGSLGDILDVDQEIGFFSLKIEPASSGWRADVGFPAGNGSKRLGFYSSREEALEHSPGDFATLLRNEAADWGRKG